MKGSTTAIEVPPRRICALLIAWFLLFHPNLAPPAQAQAECGVAASVNCAPGSYPDGINYENDTVGNIPGLSVTLQNGVNVDKAGPRDGVAVEQSGNLQLLTDGSVSIIVRGADPDRDGIRVDSIDGGNVIINSTANITTENEEGDGLIGRSNSTDLDVDPSGLMLGTGTVTITSSGTIITRGDVSAGIAAGGSGAFVNVTASGTIQTEGATESTAIAAENRGSGAANNVNVTTNGALLSTLGSQSAGIAASAARGEVVVTVNGGTITTAGDQSVGIGVASGVNDIYTIDGSLVQGAVAGGPVTITNSADISTGVGGTGRVAFGIGALSIGGRITVTNSGAVDTTGVGAHGIVAVNTQNGASANAPLTVQSSGNITTSGDSAGGILAATFVENITVVSTGVIATTGGNVDVPELDVLDPLFQPTASGIQAGSQLGSVNVTAATVITTGTRASGIVARTGIGSSAVTVTNSVSATGLNASGVIAQVQAAATATVNNEGNIFGGYGNEAAGVVLGVTLHTGFSPGATGVLNNNGTVGALSDRAVTDVETFFAGAGIRTLHVTVNNNGTITGYMTFTRSFAADVVNNDGLWHLRNFADTNGDTVRDTEAVALSNFATGTDLITNGVDGTLSLSTVAAGAAIDATGAYTPAGLNPAFHSIAQAGVEQGQMLALERFDNFGTITMQDAQTGGSGPVAGDILLISGGSVAGTPGVANTGVFRSEGGSLRLDTVLNEGGANSRSDVLVVDRTQLGSGPTQIFIANAGGAGALTVGDGIKVVDALVPANSTAGVFTLGQRVAAGIYNYGLFFGGVADPSDGDWYLRNAGLRGEPGGYIANQTAGITMFLHHLHEREGEPQYAEDLKPTPDGYRYSGWARVVGQRSQQDRSSANPFTSESKTSLFHGGMDVGRWNVFGSRDRLHVGLMASYAENSSTTTLPGNPDKVGGQVTGYAGGAYATWYENDRGKLGLYVDAWALFGRLDNKVSGQGLATEEFTSSSRTVSLEAGYAWRVFQGAPVIEPQAQAIYLDYDQDNHTEATGTVVSAADWNGAITRLGFRLHETWRWSDGHLQPFLSANWWHTTRGASIQFSGDSMQSSLPRDRYEIGAGVNATFAHHWSAWAKVDLQSDFAEYRSTEALAGLRFTW